VTNAATLPLVHRFGAFLFNITERCNLRCRHCGYGDSGRTSTMSIDDLRSWSAQVLDAGIPRIIVTGGEPFTNHRLLVETAKCVSERGGTLGVFTSAFFGTSDEAARAKLEVIPNLHTVYISSDPYHWEYVTPETAMTVARAAHEIGVKSIVICVTYAEEAELREVERRLAPIADIVTFYSARVIRTAFVDGLVRNSGTEARKLCPSDFATSCYLHTPLVNPTGTVTMCHVGKEETHGGYQDSPYILGSLRKESLHNILVRAGENPIYAYLWCHGPRGVAAAALAVDETLTNRTFTSDCDMCCKLLPVPAVRSEVEERGKIVHAVEAALSQIDQSSV
jgi:organic radical activating enzyme